MESDGQVAQSYKDRKTGLVIFGVGQIILGLLCLLFCLFAVAAGVLSHGATGAAQEKATVAASLLIYGLLALFFIWMGVGSMMARRWARALVLVFSVYWLIAGGLATLFVAFVLPRVMAAAMAVSGGATPGPGSGASLFIGTVIVVAFTAFFMVLVPAALVLFYRSPHVKATCERLDPKERWTDKVPISVLALTVLLAAGGTKLVFMFAFPAYPIFGYPLKGALAATAILVLAAALWVLAVNVYRLRRWAWTATLALTLLGFASSLVTFIRMSPEKLLDMYHIGPAQPGLAEVFGTVMPPLKVVMALMMLAWLCFLLYVLRYFRRPRVQAEPTA